MASRKGWSMAITRRRLLISAAAVPAALVAARGVELVASAALAAAPGLRPAAAGTSATRCAQCGDGGHTMLDPRCPMAPRVRA